MRRQKKCRYCGEWYTPYPQTYRRQKACSNPECQARRSREAAHRWHQKNPAYDDGRQAYVKKWRKEHPRNWPQYRAEHAESTKRNRAQQRGRDRKRRFLAKQHDSDSVHLEKLKRIRRFGDLAKQHNSDVAVLRQTEEICRYLACHFAACKTKR
ncbi:MAG: hypothetical protein LHV69_02850 [Elusimicrobia bacterium]|nr:hypothetical protein [Candidatus Obscuribacterium magneticum]